MADTFESTYMNLEIPVVSVTLGPEWATDINNCLLLIDAHDHSPGKGTPVTPDGIEISSDLTFNFFNSATDLLTSRYTNQVSSLSTASYKGAIYAAGGELYYNDFNSHSVQITSNGSVNAGAGSISGLPSGTASASYVALSGTFVWEQATSTAANMDAATLIIRYPGSYPTPAGNYIALAAPTSLSSGYFLYLPSIPAQTNVVTLNNAGQFASITYDAVGQGMSSVGANAIGIAMNSTGANAVAASTNSPNFGGTSSSSNSKSIVLWQPGIPTPPQNILMHYGLVSSAGGIVAGAGFSVVHVLTGQYQITFSSTFNHEITVVATPYTNNVVGATVYCTVASASASNFLISMTNSATNLPVDQGFYFHVIGY